jgi:protein SCO1
MTRLVPALLLCLTLPAFANPAPTEQPIPKPLEGIGIDARLGTQVPMDLPFVDQDGKAVKLRDYARPGRPIILTLNYYSCPTLCSFLLTGLMRGLKGVTFTPGNEYQVVTVSIDPKEGPKLAAPKRRTYLDVLGKQATPDAWPFLTGTEADIKRLSDAVGFRFRWDDQTKQWAHSAGIFVLTPDGLLSQVLYGIEFAPRDLRLALVEASRGAIGTPVDRLLLFCYHYDPSTRSYSPTAMGIMRIGGVLTLIVLGILLLTMWRRERRAPVVAS